MVVSTPPLGRSTLTEYAWGMMYMLRRKVEEMFSEFKKFIMRGNVLDLAVGVIIGAAFGKIVTSMVEDIIMPVIGKVLNGANFNDLYIPLKGQASDLTLEAAKKAGAVLSYGTFLTNVLNFLIISFCIF